MEANKNSGVKLTIIISICSIFIGAIIMYSLFYFFPTELSSVTNVNKLEKEVTVTDEGIADAVEKIYDAVVVVETYNNNRAISSGTGFVYKVDGDKAYIMTNNHVIEGGNKVNVTFTDGDTITTKIVGGDEYADIAVLSVDKDDIISVAEIGNSEEARVGDTVFATGAPLDSAYSWTVTRGILSGKDRMVAVSTDNSYTSDWIMKVLQTDAAINSGNSGGPLANSNGQVIGVNSLKLASTGVEGMGFSIPIEDALEFASKLENGEEIVRPLLGVSMYNLSNLQYAQMEGLKVPEGLTSGVVVAEVSDDSSADKAGLKPNDIIVKLDDEEVTDVATLKYYLYKHEVGDNVKISYYRDGKLKTASVKLVAE